jgi:hypothetical protein
MADMPEWLRVLILIAAGVCILLAWGSAVAWHRLTQLRQKRLAKGLCEHCGHDLAGNAKDVCPGCGRAT